MNSVGIFKAIVLSSLIGSIIVLLIVAIKGAFKNRLNPTFHYYIWIILIVKLIIPFRLQCPLNISNMCEKFHVQNITNENIKKTQIKFSEQLQNMDKSDSMTIDTLHSLNKNIINSAKNVPLKNKVNIEKVLCFIWLFGITALIGILVVGHKRLREIVEGSIKNINYSYKEILYNCLNDMNIKTEVELSYCPQISSPSLCGFIKPKILIPSSIVDSICDEEFKYIIMHELSHLKNKDIIINWFITLLSIIYWFNPILLYGFHKMRQDCEVFCDYKVLSRLGKGENVQYGNTIIKILKLGGNSRRLAGTTSMFTNSSEIKRRIIMISKYKKISIRGILFGSIVIVIIGVLTIAINSSNTNLYKNSSKSTEIQTKVSEVTNQNTVSNTSDGKLLASIKALPNDSTNPTAPFSSDIVIYDTHAKEDYKLASGINVCEVGALINDRLVKEGINSRFIKCTEPQEYPKAYESSRGLITKYVKNYSNTILLDIHRNAGEKDESKHIIFTLAKKSPYYEENLKFVNSLKDYIEHSSKVEPFITYYNYGTGFFNQDLSNKSVLIEIGNDYSTEKDIEDCVNALVSALKNI